MWDSSRSEIAGAVGSRIGSEAQEESADRSANQAVLETVRPLIDECRRRGDAQALGKPGKVLVWDLRSDERAVSVEKALPAGCRTTRVKGDTTLYLITAGPLADPYDGGTSPVLEVCVVSWPARQALGCYLVAGAEFTGQLARWIDSGFDPGEARMAAITRLEGKVRHNDKAPGKPIIEVSLAAGKVTDKNVEILKGLANLQTLDLSWTKVTDAGLVHLKGLVNLQNLHLGRGRSRGRGAGPPQGAGQAPDAGPVLVQGDGRWAGPSQGPSQPAEVDPARNQGDGHGRRQPAQRPAECGDCPMSG